MVGVYLIVHIEIHILSNMRKINKLEFLNKRLRWGVFYDRISMRVNKLIIIYNTSSFYILQVIGKSHIYFIFSDTSNFEFSYKTSGVFFSSSTYFDVSYSDDRKFQTK